MSEAFAPEPAAAREPRWYACYTRARHEKKVERLLREHGFESFLPLVTRISRWKDRDKAVDFVLFPSYVFARFAARDLSRVLGVPGVTAVVRGNGAPLPVPDGEIENVRRFAEAVALHGLAPVAAPLPERGTRVRFVSGPFRGIEGVVEDTRGRSRVLVGLRAIGQALEVEAAAGSLQVLG